MDLRHLRCFLAVAEDLNFHKAAQRLYIAQSALSRKVQQLEADLGVELFLRDRKQVRLTDSGELLRREGSALVRQAAKVAERVSRGNKGQTGTVRVGVAMAMADNIHHIGIEHVKRFPKVKVQYKEIFSTLQNRRLRDKDIDVGFLRPPVDAVHLASEPLFREPFAAVLPKRHPLAKRAKLRLVELADQTLFLIPRKQSVGLHDKVIELYRNAGVNPKIVHTEAMPHEAGGMLVAAGNGVYVVPTLSLRVSSDLTVVPLDEPSAWIEIHMAWRKGEGGAAIVNFLETARNVFKASPRRSAGNSTQ